MQSPGRPGAADSFLLLLLASATAAAFFPLLLAIPWSLSDSDPATYASAVLVMLAVQCVFLNAGVKSEPDAKGAAAALPVYLASAALLAFSPQSPQGQASALHPGLLSLALFFAATVLPIFGWSGARRLRFTVAYAFLAWPALATPAILAEPALVSLTAGFTQAVTAVLGLAVSRSPGNVFTSLTGEVPLIIAPQCAALTALIGFIAFMLPLAYFFKGSVRSKAGWLACGALGVIALNFARIAAVVLAWYYWGVGPAASLFQLLNGNAVFNAAIAVGLGLALVFGLRLPRLRGASFIMEGPAQAIRDAIPEIEDAAPAYASRLAFLLLAVLAFAFISVKFVAWQ
ncbi:MAG: archaeosortase/exosortase family protein [Candidatus ainarchaeum sp.]|nr:archaeosortase/exosortase family protein [Candidatus ainarchaeum sp.]